MKKILTCVLTLCPMVASADYLDDKLANLITEKQNLISQLEECQKAKGGLMVAGITTLGVSAIGIGANIGEAVALKKYDAKINTAVQTKSDLDVQIIDAQRKKAEEEDARLAAQSGVNLVYQPVMPGVDVNNTCGIQTCSPDTPTQAMLDMLNATTAVCKDGVWVAQSCKDNFTGIQKSCTLNGQLVLYIESCNSNGVQPEQKTCSEITSAWLSERNAKAGACDTTTGENYITECADNSFNGVPRTTGNKQGYEKCEKSGTEQKTCSEITPAWLAERNAKAGACDTITGENYITECADTHTEVKDANGRITECQQKQPVTPPQPTPVVNNVPECGATCSTQCDVDCALSTLSATETVCVNGVHKPTNCYVGDPIGEPQQCKIGNEIITYYESCPPYEKPKGCIGSEETFKAQQHAKLVRCNEETGKLFIVVCEDGYKPVMPLKDGGYLQCVKDDTPVEENTESKPKSIYETMRDENDALSAKISDSTIPAEASLLQKKVKEDREFIVRTEEMIDASRDNYGNIPAWNLVANAVAAPSVPTVSNLVPVQPNDSTYVAPTYNVPVTTVQTQQPVSSTSGATTTTSASNTSTTGTSFWQSVGNATLNSWGAPGLGYGR